MERRKKLLDTSKDLICIFFFQLRNSVVNDAVANKGKTIANNQEGSQWIGIRTDSNITTNSSQPQRNFFYLSGGPFTSIPYGQWAIE